MVKKKEFLTSGQLTQLHFVVNDMDNAIYEIDVYAPGLFIRTAEQLSKVIFFRNCSG